MPHFFAEKIVRLLSENGQNKIVEEIFIKIRISQQPLNIVSSQKEEKIPVHFTFTKVDSSRKAKESLINSSISTILARFYAIFDQNAVKTRISTSKSTKFVNFRHSYPSVILPYTAPL